MNQSKLEDEMNTALHAFTDTSDSGKTVLHIEYTVKEGNLGITRRLQFTLLDTPFKITVESVIGNLHNAAAILQADFSHYSKAVKKL